jgi:hypothetical protein
MSNQNDLDDQLYILLASMKEYREAIADDNKRLEQFYNQVASGVLDKAEKSLENANKKHTGALNNSIQALNEATQAQLKTYHYFCQHVCCCDDGIHFGYLLIHTKQRRN